MIHVKRFLLCWFVLLSSTAFSQVDYHAKRIFIDSDGNGTYTTLTESMLQGVASPAPTPTPVPMNPLHPSSLVVDGTGSFGDQVSGTKLSLYATETTSSYYRPVSFRMYSTATPGQAPGIAIDYHGIDVQVQPTGSNCNNYVGIYPLESHATNLTNSTVARMVPFYALADIRGAGGVTQDVTLCQMWLQNSGTASIPATYGTRFYTPTNSGGGYLGPIYANYVAALTGVTTNTVYALYAEDSAIYTGGDITGTNIKANGTLSASGVTSTAVTNIYGTTQVYSRLTGYAGLADSTFQTAQKVSGYLTWASRNASGATGGGQSNMDLSNIGSITANKYITLGTATGSTTGCIYLSGDLITSAAVRSNYVTANTYIDYTPFDTESTTDALNAIGRISADANGNLDHSTLPPMAQKTIRRTDTRDLSIEQPVVVSGDIVSVTNRITTTMKEDGTITTKPIQIVMYETPGRDIGAMTSVLTRAVQHLKRRVKEQQDQIDEQRADFRELKKAFNAYVAAHP